MLQDSSYELYQKGKISTKKVNNKIRIKKERGKRVTIKGDQVSKEEKNFIEFVSDFIFSSNSDS